MRDMVPRRRLWLRWRRRWRLLLEELLELPEVLVELLLLMVLLLVDVWIEHHGASSGTLHRVGRCTRRGGGAECTVP